MQDGIGEPMVEVSAAAALARRRRFLVLAFGTVRRTVNADVEMIIVSPPRSHFAQPRAVAAAGIATQGSLDGWIDEDAADLRIFRCRLDHGDVRRGPYIGIDVFAVLRDH